MCVSCPPRPCPAPCGQGNRHHLVPLPAAVLQPLPTAALWAAPSHSPTRRGAWRRCCVDIHPRKMRAGDLSVLTNLAEMVVRELEKDCRLQLQKLVRSCLPRACAARLQAAGMVPTGSWWTRTGCRGTSKLQHGVPPAPLRQAHQAA